MNKRLLTLVGIQVVSTSKGIIIYLRIYQLLFDDVWFTDFNCNVCNYYYLIYLYLIQCMIVHVFQWCNTYNFTSNESNSVPIAPMRNMAGLRLGRDAVAISNGETGATKTGDTGDTCIWCTHELFNDFFGEVLSTMDSQIPHNRGEFLVGTLNLWSRRWTPHSTNWVHSVDDRFFFKNYLWSNR